MGRLCILLMSSVEIYQQLADGQYVARGSPGSPKSQSPRSRGATMGPSYRHNGSEFGLCRPRSTSPFSGGMLRGRDDNEMKLIQLPNGRSIQVLKNPCISPPQTANPQPSQAKMTAAVRPQWTPEKLESLVCDKIFAKTNSVDLLPETHMLHCS